MRLLVVVFVVALLVSCCDAHFGNPADHNTTWSASVTTVGGNATGILVQRGLSMEMSEDRLEAFLVPYVVDSGSLEEENVRDLDYGVLLAKITLSNDTDTIEYDLPELAELGPLPNQVQLPLSNEYLLSFYADFQADGSVVKPLGPYNTVVGAPYGYADFNIIINSTLPMETRIRFNLYFPFEYETKTDNSSVDRVSYVLETMPGGTAIFSFFNVTVLDEVDVVNMTFETGVDGRVAWVDLIVAPFVGSAHLAADAFVSLTPSDIADYIDRIDGNKLSAGAIVGICIGAAVAFLIVLLIIFHEATGKWVPCQSKGSPKYAPHGEMDEL